MMDEAKKQLKDSFVKLYAEQKTEMSPIVVRIVADRNTKMGAITIAKQKLVKAYDEVRRELAKTYPQELVNECLISRSIMLLRKHMRMYRRVWPIRVFRCRDMKSDF